VTWTEVVKVAAIYAIIGLFHWFFRARFLTLSFHSGEAVRRGWSVRLWDFLFYASFGVVITSSVQIAGVLLVFSFLIVPALCATFFSAHIDARLGIGWVIGFVVSAVGCSLSYLWDLPTGATVVCTFGVALLVLSAVRLIRGS
jgi:zinc/manganese transport system permease protein